MPERNKYEIVLNWSQDDQAFIAEVYEEAMNLGD